MPNLVQSLRFKLLLPILAASVLAACAVAVASYWLGYRRAEEDVRQRFDGIRETLSNASFSLSQPVLESISQLTGTEIITANSAAPDGLAIAKSTLTPDELRRFEQTFEPSYANRASRGTDDTLPDATDVPVRASPYLVYTFQRHSAAEDRTVFVLFAEQGLRTLRWTAAVLPLATGLSTILLLGALMLTLAGRLVRRLTRLHRQVERVAGGDFDSPAADHGNDEVGRLSQAVDSMAAQLKQLWTAVNRQQREKLIHQLASGMAHQLRNTVTGARMAIELHAGVCSADDEGMSVALRQMEQLEAHVRRLMLVGSGAQEQNRPAAALVCLQDVQASLSALLQHLRVSIQWRLDGLDASWQVLDGPAFTGAVSNLVLNASQAGDEVEVTAIREGDRLEIVVADNGPGIAADIGKDVFDAFVTTKPEGLGLGLAIVRRAAEQLRGRVEWKRAQERTLFVLQVHVEQGAKS
ncbi:MAG: HAMP domain-containing histidine kinase [Planctomycetales bacterium]|nr:HAMP domain-containing histidine kinase [Planctomycetales bacterium]